MAEAGAVLPGALEPERFFGRVEELRRLHREARALVRGQGRSRVLCARPGTGKTELLKQWHGRLFGAGKILPFWYPVPRHLRDPADLGSDYVAAFALQALAFRRRDASLLTRSLSREQLAEGLRSGWGRGGELLAEALIGTEARFHGPAALARAAVVPHRFAACSGTRVHCLIDDAGGICPGRGWHPWPEEAAASAVAPALFAIEDESVLSRVFGSTTASLVSFDRLAPLSGEAIARLARHLARTAGLELGEQAVAALVGESAGSPFYLGALVRALAGGTGTGAFDVARTAAASLCEGELARYWFERLNRAIPDRRTRATALEILIYCLRDGDGSSEAGRLATHMLKPDDAVEAALAGLVKAGVVHADYARIRVDDDPVLHDVVRALYRREFGRMAPGAVVALLAAEKVRGAHSQRRRLWRETLRGVLRGVFGAWAAQRVPAVLFDAAAFRARYGRDDGEAAVTGVSDESELITLPQVISVASGRVGSGVSLPVLEVDALAWAQRAEAGMPDADVAWVARLLPGGAGGDEQIGQFDRDVAALQMAGELPAERLVRWAILESPLDAAGEQAAAQLRLSTSTLQQLGALAGLLGVTTVLPPPVPASCAGPELEMEMVIPRFADIELVAARALEQLAENLALDARAIGGIKVALVEACINAFEHGGARDGRVRLVFTIDGERLKILVENRGRPLAALPPVSPRGREARGRGWGLTLIRELVDEVVLEPREDGVSLLMVKHFGSKHHG